MKKKTKKHIQEKIMSLIAKNMEEYRLYLEATTDYSQEQILALIKNSHVVEVEKYKEMLRRAYSDGVVQPEERAALEKLMKELGIDRTTALSLEREVAQLKAVTEEKESMTVYELNEDQMNLLKQNYLTQHLEEVENRSPSMDELANASETVSDWLILDAYKDTIFSKDDFLTEENKLENPDYTPVRNFKINGEVYTQKEIEDAVLGDITELFKELEPSPKINGIRLYKNPEKRGMINVLLEYEKGWREDDLFNCIAEEGLTFNGFKVDVNPITPEKSGTIDEYMKFLERNNYLVELDFDWSQFDERRFNNFKSAVNKRNDRGDYYGCIKSGTVLNDIYLRDNGMSFEHDYPDDASEYGTYESDNGNKLKYAACSGSILPFDEVSKIIDMSYEEFKNYMETKCTDSLRSNNIIEHAKGNVISWDELADAKNQEIDEKKKSVSFEDDVEKMRDFLQLDRDEFLDSYSYLTDEEYDETLKAVEKFVGLKEEKVKLSLKGIFDAKAEALSDFDSDTMILAGGDSIERDGDHRYYDLYDSNRELILKDEELPVKIAEINDFSYFKINDNVFALNKEEVEAGKLQVLTEELDVNLKEKNEESLRLDAEDEDMERANGLREMGAKEEILWFPTYNGRASDYTSYNGHSIERYFAGLDQKGENIYSVAVDGIHLTFVDEASNEEQELFFSESDLNKQIVNDTLYYGNSMNSINVNVQKSEEKGMRSPELKTYHTLKKKDVENLQIISD